MIFTMLATVCQIKLQINDKEHSASHLSYQENDLIKAININRLEKSTIWGEGLSYRVPNFLNVDLN